MQVPQGIHAGVLTTLIRVAGTPKKKRVERQQCPGHEGVGDPEEVCRGGVGGELMRVRVRRAIQLGLLKTSGPGA